MLEIQKAIIDKLELNLAVCVFGYVPENQDFPYVVVDYPESDNNDTDTENGYDSNVQIATYSRYRGTKEAADIAKKIYNTLHRQPMADTDSYGISTIHQNFGNIFTDEGGVTRISVQRFKVIFEPLP